jgi:hypothetical protein
MGDFNAYLQEDPLGVLSAGGYTNLGSPDEYSFVFMGQSGSLDHAFVSASLMPAVTGHAEWHINTDEPRHRDYNDDIDSFPPANGNDDDLNQPYLYETNAFRTSDHDPLLVGLNLLPPMPTPTGTVMVTLTETPSPTATDMPTLTATDTPTETPTETPSPMVTDTPTPLPTDTPTNTPPPTFTPSPSFTFTFTPTRTFTPSRTNTPSRTPTFTSVPPTVNPLSVCWVKHWNGTGSTEWRITNPNPVPIVSVPDTKVRYNWYVYNQPNAQGNIVQSAQNWDNANPNPLNTVYAQSIRLEWYLVTNGVSSQILGTALANADASGQCH